jgi:hypothetical protein
MNGASGTYVAIHKDLHVIRVPEGKGKVHDAGQRSI